ncbi:Crp/Fnr family transcriptional regulator [Alginatibacterium sediminis]|uniref:Crp/Fnr family transcriptional regulator n=1 Tax=Alginatibacterium sediminis TaxID=2164068 RepID=A0A420E6C1_9ALTE|nr:helix-turn-helix domain-containing protein [Alginatibacterium sediminis]RKF13256.1 Crp/Fnr family transcriptional regulator [Alginatibacterium sediminis]
MIPNDIRSSVVWPCILSEGLTNALLDKAQFFESFNEMGYNKSGSVPKGVVYVLSGATAVYFHSSPKDCSYVGLLASTSWLGASGFQDNLFQDLTIEYEPIVDLSFVLFNYSDIEDICERQPECHKWLFSCSRQMSFNLFQFNFLQNYSVKQRIIYSLFYLLAKTQTPLKGSFPSLAVSQTVLAIASGVGRPRVNQVIKGLSDEGLVSFESRKTTFLDLEGLAQKLDGIEFTIYDPVSIVLTRYQKDKP